VTARSRAARYFAELARRGFGGLGQVEAFENHAALEALAEVLAAHDGHPMRLLEGEPRPRASAAALWQ
jgi:hypothetical protein